MKIVFDPYKKEADKNEILIGLGNCEKCINKNEKFDSCAEFLVHNPIKYGGEKIVIEDFSPDTVITIYMLINGKIPKKYIDYATKWEVGESDRDVFKSYGVLQNALINSIDGNESVKVEKSLEFLDFLIKNDYDLDNIPSNDNPLYKLAFKKLQNEYKKFDETLKNAEIYTLKINGRKVNAVFLDNVSVTPLVKLLLRQKFEFIASFNEKYKGAGNDVVISVSPESGLNLKELWENIEKAETEKWQGKRPSDNPRKIVSTDKWNEPWWDDMGKYTLIAAPKKTGEMFGSKLDYDEVKRIILQTYKGERDE
ncbi:hypothetical protein C3L23_09055 [Nautilia sp. PV-1]|uniref:hypothetical protein n=1 Tax=Nautilia sp. PV-1 TaxID=2579250 RepID=UPI000FDC79EE|nr:hypothetical protein [Nautilia sp. PV-1]AZV47411.1 hypothetical protein C3L23_09055 [Nautilia sp. PV-1]